jgi:hypothetical protein
VGSNRTEHQDRARSEICKRLTFVNATVEDAMGAWTAWLDKCMADPESRGNMRVLRRRLSSRERTALDVFTLIGLERFTAVFREVKADG